MNKQINVPQIIEHFGILAQISDDAQKEIQVYQHSVKEVNCNHRFKKTVQLKVINDNYALGWTRCPNCGKFLTLIQDRGQF